MQQKMICAVKSIFRQKIVVVSLKKPKRIVADGEHQKMSKPPFQEMKMRWVRNARSLRQGSLRSQ